MSAKDIDPEIEATLNSPVFEATFKRIFDNPELKRAWRQYIQQVDQLGPGPRRKKLKLFLAREYRMTPKQIGAMTPSEVVLYIKARLENPTYKIPPQTGLEDEPIALDYEDIAILKALQEHAPRLMTQIEIETNSGVSRKTVGVRLKKLAAAGLVRQVGKKGGNTITTKGSELLRAAVHKYPIITQSLRT